MTGRVARVRRLLGDLRRPQTRREALTRIQRRVIRTIRGGAVSEGKARTGSTASKPKAAVDKRVERYATAWSRVAAAVWGPTPVADEPPTATRATDAAQLVTRYRAEGSLAEALARGETLEGAVTRSVASLADADTQGWRNFNTAWAMAEGVRRLPGGETAGVLGHAVLRHRQRQFERVWNLIRDLPDVVLSTYIPIEAVDAALAIGSEERKRALSIGVPSAAMPADVLVDLAGRFLSFGERGRAAELVAELRGRPSVDLDQRRRYSWSLIEGWLSGRETSVPAGAIPIAVLDYQTPDHGQTSGNVGDYVQSLAMVGNIVRLTDVSFSGDDGLSALAT